MATERADLLVVGAGPVGLAAAVAATRVGLRTVVVDRSRRSALHSYALALHPSSLALLDGWGVLDELLPLGRRIEGSRVHADGDELGTFSLAALGVEHPFALALGQPWLEGALEQALERAGAPVLWEHALVSFEPREDEVRAVVARLDAAGGEDDPPPTAEIRASWVLGADGGESTVRRLIDVESMRSDEVASYRLIEHEAAAEPEPVQRLVLDGRSLHALWPLAGGRARWSLQFDGPEDDDPPERAIVAMERHGAWVAPVDEVLWDTSVRFERRLARALGAGRVWLAGDAARACRPLGVQSMNAGLTEVEAFVEALASGGDVAGRLAIWSDRVRAAWRGLLEPERRLSFADDAPAWARDHATRLVDGLPATGEDLVTLLAQHGIRYRTV